MPSNLVIRYGEPPPAAAVLSNEILDYIAANYGQYRKAYEESEGSDESKLRRRKKKM